MPASSPLKALRKKSSPYAKTRHRRRQRQAETKRRTRRPRHRGLRTISITDTQQKITELEETLGDKLYVGLFHPTEGQVNLYETRFTSDKLRTTQVPSLRSSAAPALPCWF
jgi:hypothetical protein